MSKLSLPSTTPYFLEIINQGNLDDDSQLVNQFIPRINYALTKSLKKASPLKDIYSGIYYCNLIKYQFNKISCKSKDFHYINDIFFKPLIQTPDGRCLDYENPEIVNLLLNNLGKHNQIDPMNIITPKQDKNNCWFNTAFMVFFISDLGRKFSKFFRHFCITGNLDHVKQTDDILRLSFFYLNIYIDSCIQGSSYSFYINSNYLVDRIYDTIPPDDNIRKSDKTGDPLRYYFSLITKLSLFKSRNFNPLYQITLGRNNLPTLSKAIQYIEQGHLFGNNQTLETQSNKETFVLFPRRVINPPDILLVYIDLKKYPTLNVSDKKKYLYISQAIYCLDSVIIVHVNNPHVCCLITINKEYFLYDGASYRHLIPFKWLKYLNSSQDITFGCSKEIDSKEKGIINFKKSPQQVLIYYRIK